MVVTLARPELFDRRPDWGANQRHLTALALEPLTDETMRELLVGLVPGLPDDAVARSSRAPRACRSTRSRRSGLLADGRLERRRRPLRPVGDLRRSPSRTSLRSLIASRLDALEAADRSLLQDASVLGQIFAADALAAITGVSRG